MTSGIPWPPSWLMICLHFACDELGIGMAGFNRGLKAVEIDRFHQVLGKAGFAALHYV
jgi:hypothetical protein